MNRPITLIAAAAILAAAGCSTPPAAEPRAATPKPLTLHLVTEDGPQDPGGLEVAHFVEQVDDLSDGDIRVEPEFKVGSGETHYDQYVASQVIDGDADLAMVPSRAWDDVGVTSLTALTAPFLVTTDTLTDVVVTDDDLAARLTSGLPAVGVSALGLFPEGLRHPFGFDGALGGPADYDGAIVGAPYSRSTEAMLAAWGATSADSGVDPADMVGAESSYRLAPNGVATGNVTFYPKVQVLVIGEDVRADLTESQARVLQEAADATQDWVLETRPSDAEAAQTFCSELGEIAAADPVDVTALEAASKSVVDGLRTDPTTDQLVTDIEAMAADDPTVDPVTSCPDAPAAGASQVDGSYRVEVTPEAMTAAGVTDQHILEDNAGSWTITLADGEWSAEQVYVTGPDAGTTWHGDGGFTLDGDRLRFIWGHSPGEWTESDVTRTDDGALEFTNVQDGGGAQLQAFSDVLFTRWERTGG